MMESTTKAKIDLVELYTWIMRKTWEKRKNVNKDYLSPTLLNSARIVWSIADGLDIRMWRVPEGLIPLYVLASESALDDGTSFSDDLDMLMRAIGDAERLAVANPNAAEDTYTEVKCTADIDFNPRTNIKRQATNKKAKKIYGSQRKARQAANYFIHFLELKGYHALSTNTYAAPIDQLARELEKMGGYKAAVAKGWSPSVLLSVSYKREYADLLELFLAFGSEGRKQGGDYQRAFIKAILSSPVASLTELGNDVHEENFSIDFYCAVNLVSKHGFWQGMELLKNSLRAYYNRRVAIFKLMFFAELMRGGEVCEEFLDCNAVEEYSLDYSPVVNVINIVQNYAFPNEMRVPYVQPSFFGFVPDGISNLRKRLSKLFPSIGKRMKQDQMTRVLETGGVLTAAIVKSSNASTVLRNIVRDMYHHPLDAKRSSDVSAFVQYLLASWGEDSTTMLAWKRIIELAKEETPGVAYVLAFIYLFLFSPLEDMDEETSRILYPIRSANDYWNSDALNFQCCPLAAGEALGYILHRAVSLPDSENQFYKWAIKAIEVLLGYATHSMPSAKTHADFALAFRRVTRDLLNKVGDSKRDELVAKMQDIIAPPFLWILNMI